MRVFNIICLLFYAVTGKDCFDSIVYYNPILKTIECTDTISLQKQIENLKKADALKTLKYNIGFKDFRLIAIRGFAYQFPGLNKFDQFDTLVTIYGFKVIEGTSDNISSPEISTINQLAGIYAFHYNQLLIKYLSSFDKRAKEMQLSRLSQKPF
jgi:hypothetical protein